MSRTTASILELAKRLQGDPPAEGVVGPPFDREPAARLGRGRRVDAERKQPVLTWKAVARGCEDVLRRRGESVGAAEQLLTLLAPGGYPRRSAEWNVATVKLRASRSAR